MKKNNIKKIVAIYLVVVLVLSVLAVVGVSAKTYTSNHTVEVATVKDDYDYEPAYMGGLGRISDTFQANPTIFDEYSSSTDTVSVYYEGTNTILASTRITLYGNSGAPKTVIYGDKFEQNYYTIKYVYYSGGGFRASSILSRTY